MSETYQKCSCRTCGGHIEFPSHAVGMSIGCPHCGATTDLYAEPPMPAPLAAPPPPPPPQPQAPRLQVAGFQSAVSSQPQLQVAAPPPPVETAYETQYAEASTAGRGPVNWMGWSLASVSILLFLVGGGMYLKNLSQGKSVFGDTRSARGALKSAAVKPAADEDEEEPAAGANGSKATKAASRAKAIEDLKPGPITLQKGQGSLVYAVGTLRNDSDHQRLGVRVELDLLDASGKQILVNGKPAKAQDYVQVIEPHGNWRFRALVVAPRTASVRVAKIKEEE